MVEETEWKSVEPWPNGRIMDTFISSNEIDLHNDHIDPALFEKILPWLQDYGYYEWEHSGITIGKIIGWRFAKDPVDNEVKPMIKVGIHDTKSSNMPIHDEVWTKIKDLGLKGMSSIKGMANNQKTEWNGTDKYNDITDLGVFAVGYVLEDAANTGASVSAIDFTAKELVAKSKEAHDRILKSTTGDGQGTGNEPEGTGGTETCYCHECNITVKHKRGSPCNDLNCPKCGNPLTGMEKSTNHSLKNEIHQMDKEINKLEKEATALTDEKEMKKKLEEMVLKVKTMQDSLKKEEEPPEAEAEGDEEPTDEGEPAVIAELESDIDQLATAIEALEPGTPEAVAEAVEIAADVKIDGDTEPNDIEMKKTVEELTKKLTDMNSKLEKYMSQPVRKTGQSPSQIPATSNPGGFGDDSIASLTKSFQGTKAEQAKIWKDHGFNRVR